LKMKSSRNSNWFEKQFFAFASEFEELEFSTPHIEDDKVYEIEIFLDAKHEKKLTTLQCTGRKFKWTPPRPGLFYWRLRYQDYWERWSEFSDVSRMDIRPIPVQRKSPKRVAKKPRPIKP